MRRNISCLCWTSSNHNLQPHLSLSLFFLNVFSRNPSFARIHPPATRPETLLIDGLRRPYTLTCNLTCTPLFAIFDYPGKTCTSLFLFLFVFFLFFYIHFFSLFVILFYCEMVAHIFFYDVLVNMNVQTHVIQRVFP